MTLPNSFTAVLERNTTVDSELVTEPYEVAWAREARFFVRVLDQSGSSVLDVHTQISPDGLHWCDLDDHVHRVDPAAGTLHSWTAQEFGGWLRLRATASNPDGANAAVKVLVYLALKA